MGRQRFTTTDVLALEVQADYPEGQAPNLMPNPSGDLGGWGWHSPTANTRVRTHDTGHGLRFETTAALAATSVDFYSDRIKLDGPITYVQLLAERIASSGPYVVGSNAGVKASVDINFYDDADTLLGTASTSNIAPGEGFLLSYDGSIPAGTTQVEAQVSLGTGTGGLLNGAYMVLHDVVLNATDDREMYVEPGWVDILGPSLSLEVERLPLDLGLLTATVRDATLDPATATTIRKGKPVRCTTAGGDLILATIRDAKVTYALLEDDPDRRATIVLTAVDATARPAGIPSPHGVATVAELAHLFEYAQTPWNLDGDSGHPGDSTPVTVSTNPAATLLDQVALTRDSVLGHAWVDRHGAVNVWNAAALDAHTAKDLAVVLDEDRYDDIVLDYDTDRCINSVGIKYLRLDPVTGETEEVTYGPFRDDPSVAQWGLHHDDFTVHGIAEEALEAYAAAILTANATPRRIVTEATLTLRTDTDLDDFSTIDLYDRLRVVNTRGEVDEDLRVVSIKHRVTHNRWTLTLGFATGESVATPQLIPSPPPTAVESLASLLRPVGEVTMMPALPSKLWPGWLICDGSSFDPATYPELADFLGDTHTPDYTDRLVVGAGVKAVGDASGSWTVTLATNQLPSHDHPAAGGTLGGSIPRRAAAGTTGGVAMGSGTVQADLATNITGRTGNTGGGNPVDITPRVRAAYYVIRARSGA